MRAEAACERRQHASGGSMRAEAARHFCGHVDNVGFAVIMAFANQSGSLYALVPRIPLARYPYERGARRDNRQ